MKESIDRKPALMKKVISKRIMCEKLGVSPTTLWRMVKRGEFPAPIQISPGRVGWLEDEADGYIESCPRVGGAFESGAAE